jgi:hypothetical protein
MKTSAHQTRLRAFTVIVTIVVGALALAPSALAGGATTSVPGLSDTLAQTASHAGDVLDAASDAVNGAHEEMPLVEAVAQAASPPAAPAEGPSTAGGQAGGSPGSEGSSESQQGTVQASSEPGDVASPKPPPAHASNSPAGSAPAHGGKGSGGPRQSNSTSQSAGSSATTIQIAPINVVIPILIGSNGVVHVANIASANSGATNTNGTIQVVGAPHPGGAANGPANGLEAVRDSTTQAIASLATNTTASISVVLDWNWDWNWSWDLGTLPGWSEAPGSQPSATNPNAHGDSTTFAHRVPRGAGSRGAALAASGGSAGNNDDRSASSSIVQIPAKQPVFPAVDGLPAPGAPAGGGISTFTLLVGALAALLFQFVSAAGLLGRRLSLAGMGWQRQAYLSPPQRPG